MTNVWSAKYFDPAEHDRLVAKWFAAQELADTWREISTSQQQLVEGMAREIVNLQHARDDMQAEIVRLRAAHSLRAVS